MSPPGHRRGGCPNAAPGSGRFERRQRIRFSHCDPAGIVFYPQYFVLFNGLVEDWVSDGLGVSYVRLVVERRIGLPTVSLQTEFRAVSRMGDEVSLVLQVERLGARSLTLALACDGDDGRRAEVRQVVVCTSLQTHRSQPFPPDLRAAIERFQDAAAATGGETTRNPVV